MILLGNSLIGLAQLLGSLIFIAQILIIIRVVASWMGADPYNKIVQFINASTEPMLRPIRRYVPLIGGGLDLSPLLLLLALFFIDRALVQSLIDYGVQLKQGV